MKELRCDFCCKDARYIDENGNLFCDFHKEVEELQIKEDKESRKCEEERLNKERV